MNNMQFGKVYVASKKLSSSGNSYTVTLRQNTTMQVEPLENNRFALAHTDNMVTEPRIVESKRTNNQTVRLEDGDKYIVGKEVGGHIQRITHATPQWDGHKVAYEGGFPTSEWHPTFVEDVDLR